MAKRTKGGKKARAGGVDDEIAQRENRKARKEAAEADEVETTKKTISFGTNNGNSKGKAAAPLKPALKKGPREKIKTFKHEMVVGVKIKISYTRQKNEVRKQVYNCLGGTLDFFRETLLEGKSDVAFLGKEE